MATLVKRGKRWTAQVYKRGIRKAKTFDTKGQASAWATQTEAEILAGSFHAGTDKTFLDAVERYRETVTSTKKSARSENYHLNMLSRLGFADKRLSDITSEDIAKVRDEKLKTLKTGTVRRYLSLLSSIFEYSKKEWGWITDNPCSQIKKPSGGKSRDRIFSDDEVSALLAAMNYGGPASEIQQTIADVFLFALETAMRAAEIVTLEWAMINGRVATLMDTKNGDKRDVALSSAALAILDKRRAFDKPFKVKTTTLSTLFGVYTAKAGIEGATFHDTRHTAITRMARKLTPFELARTVGHRNLSQTLAYFNETADQIAAKLD